MKSLTPLSWSAYSGIFSGILLLSLGMHYQADIVVCFKNLITDTLSGLSSTACDFISSVFYTAGIGFGIKSALKFKENNENPQSHPLWQSVALSCLATVLLGLPCVLTSSNPISFDSPYLYSLGQSNIPLD